VIASPPSSAQLPELYVDPKTFDKQMEWLKQQGYAGVSLNQVYDAWFKNGELPEKPVVVSSTTAIAANTSTPVPSSASSGGRGC